mmetsp:Transcript_214/g.784  ORF Transcript_214/g.784 Transcript_214/m.784 type:complete len:285 (-) Transcript_214:747-1601(-)
MPHTAAARPRLGHLGAPLSGHDPRPRRGVARACLRVRPDVRRALARPLARGHVAGGPRPVAAARAPESARLSPESARARRGGRAGERGGGGGGGGARLHLGALAPPLPRCRPAGQGGRGGGRGRAGRAGGGVVCGAAPPGGGSGRWGGMSVVELVTAHAVVRDACCGATPGDAAGPTRHVTDCARTPTLPRTLGGGRDGGRRTADPAGGASRRSRAAHLHTFLQLCTVHARSVTLQLGQLRAGCWQCQAHRTRATWQLGAAPPHPHGLSPSFVSPSAVRAATPR